MVGIQGLGGIPEPANNRQAQGKDRPSTPVTPASSDDDVSISTEAAKASAAGDIVRRSEESTDIRAERIEQAKQNIEEGTYRVQEVVLQVASRIAHYVS